MRALLCAGLLAGCSTLRPDPCVSWPRYVDTGAAITLAGLGAGAATLTVMSDDTGGVGQLKRLAPATATLTLGLLSGVFAGAVLASATRSCPVDPPTEPSGLSGG